MDAEIAKLDYTKSGFDSLYGKVLNFIHYEIDESRLWAELLTYAQTLGRGDAAERLKKSKVGIETSIAYCVNRGAILPPKSIQRVITLLDAKETKEEEAIPEWEAIPETVRGKNIQSYVSCYSRIDNAKTRVLNGKLGPRDFVPEIRSIINTFSNGKTAVIKMLLEHYKATYIESRGEEACKLWLKPLSTIVDTLNLMINSKASVKAGAKGAKARKMNSTVHQVDRKGEKAASKVTYKDEDTAFGIRSVDPTNVVGADAAVIFNTKNRHCEVYYAKAGSKLSIQGAKIINYDETRSVGKTVRNPEMDLPQWTKATVIRRLDVLLQNTNGKAWELSGKLNRNTVIIKVM